MSRPFLRVGALLADLRSRSCAHNMLHTHMRVCVQARTLAAAAGAKGTRKKKITAALSPPPSTPPSVPFPFPSLSVPETPSSPPPWPGSALPPIIPAITLNDAEDGEDAGSASSASSPTCPDTESDEAGVARVYRKIPPFYERLQEVFGDHLNLYQKGKFYELWGPDADAACRVVPLRQGASGIAGFPFERASHWLAKILDAGHTVVLVEQDASEKGGSSGDGDAEVAEENGASTGARTTPSTKRRSSAATKKATASAPRPTYSNPTVPPLMLPPFPSAYLEEDMMGTSSRALSTKRRVRRIFTPATIPADLRMGDGDASGSIVLAISTLDEGGAAEKGGKDEKTRASSPPLTSVAKSPSLSLNPSTAATPLALVWIDATTGKVQHARADTLTILDHIARIQPKEILLAQPDPTTLVLHRVPIPNDTRPWVRLPGFGSTPTPPETQRNESTGDDEFSDSNGAQSLSTSIPAPSHSQEREAHAFLSRFGLGGLRDVYVTAVPTSWLAPSSVLKTASVTSSPLFCAIPPLFHASLSMSVSYLRLTMQESVPRLSQHGEYLTREHLEMDAVTRQSLELLWATTSTSTSSSSSFSSATSSVAKRVRGSLLWVLDRTSTKQGRRLLRERITAPLTNIDAINSRQGLVAVLVDDTNLLSNARAELKGFPDLTSLVQTLVRLAEGGFVGISSVNLHELLLGLTDALTAASNIRTVLEGFAINQRSSSSPLKPQDTALLDNIFSSVSQHELIQLLSHATKTLSRKPDELIELSTSPDVEVLNGELLAIGQEVRSLMRKYQAMLEEKHQKFKDSTSHKKFVCSTDTSQGYLIQTLRELSSFFDPAVFVRQSSLSPYIHAFTTEELMGLHERARKCANKVYELRQQHIRNLADLFTRYAAQITTLADAISELDVACSLASVAKTRGFTRPTLVPEPILDIQHGSHPVVAMMQPDLAFVTNTLTFTDRDRLWIITGPNMGGKSTFLRQNALIVIMAQLGSFVPATKAVVGVVDRIFTRIGASDNLSENKSTFMLEMEETARIVNHASPHSLVLLDEIGRGTSVADGLAVAAAVCHHLALVPKCRTLFATHLHQLSSLSQNGKEEDNVSGGTTTPAIASDTRFEHPLQGVPGVSSHHLAVPEVQQDSGQLVFSHLIQRGCVTQSHGLAVARLAGMDPQVLQHASVIKARLESVLGRVDKEVAAAVMVGIGKDE